MSGSESALVKESGVGVLMMGDTVGDSEVPEVQEASASNNELNIKIRMASFMNTPTIHGRWLILYVDVTRLYKFQ